MYLFPNEGYYDRDGQQHARRGWFLLLMQPNQPRDSIATIGEWLRLNRPHALVRKVALVQFGHTMMGRAHVFGHQLTVEGAYGNLGLTMDVPQEIYDLGVLLDPEVDRIMGADTTGWNDAGVSGKVVREWAIQHFEELIPFRLRFPSTRRWGRYNLTLDHTTADFGYYKTAIEAPQQRFWFKRQDRKMPLLCMGYWN